MKNKNGQTNTMISLGSWLISASPDWWWFSSHDLKCKTLSFQNVSDVLFHTLLSADGFSDVNTGLQSWLDRLCAHSGGLHDNKVLTLPRGTLESAAPERCNLMGDSKIDFLLLPCGQHLICKKHTSHPWDDTRLKTVEPRRVWVRLFFLTDEASHRQPELSECHWSATAFHFPSQIPPCLSGPLAVTLQLTWNTGIAVLTHLFFLITLAVMIPQNQALVWSLKFLFSLHIK